MSAQHKEDLVILQEPDAWEILKDCEEIADEYKTR